MDFKANKPIYQQIVDFCFGKILTEEWKGEERIPSVRELAVLLTVNPHTVLKAFEYLQNEDIIYPKRGMGFFLDKEAGQQVLKLKKNEFFEMDLTEIFQTMDLLGVSMEEVVEKYQKRKRDTV